MLHCTFSILIFILIILPTNAIFYDNYYLQSQCLRTVNVTRNSVGIVKPSSGSFYLTGMNCQLLFNVPDPYGIALTVEDLDLRRRFGSCLDTLMVTSLSEKPRIVLGPTCKSAERYFENTGNWLITFSSSGQYDDKIYYKGFRIVYTVFHERPCSRNEFECFSNKICIPESLTCDGINNCGDNSDEDGYDFAKCRSEFLNREKIIGATFGVIFFLVIVIGIVYMMIQRRATRSAVPYTISR